MTLGYIQNFKDGTPTYFMEKILLGLVAYAARQLQPVETDISIREIVAEHAFEPKLHSIREDQHNRWFPGREIHHVYNPRRPTRQCFLKNKCISTQRINVIITGVPIIGTDSNGRDRQIGKQPLVLVDGRTMSKERVETIARNDGFPSVEAFFGFFDRDFSGKIIHWTKLRY